jgi:NitT/TauT family transport system substrate-binding protein
VADKNTAQQGYLTSEPFAIQKAGVKANVPDLFSDQASPRTPPRCRAWTKTVKDRSKQVAAFVKASAWKAGRATWPTRRPATR